MITADFIYKILEQQAPVLQNHFVQDAPSVGKDESERKAINLFKAIPIYDSKTNDVLDMEIISELINLSDLAESESVAKSVASMYATLRKQIEVGVGKALILRKFKSVCGESRSVLYGTWRLLRNNGEFRFVGHIKVSGIK